MKLDNQTKLDPTLSDKTCTLPFVSIFWDACLSKMSARPSDRCQARKNCSLRRIREAHSRENVPCRRRPGTPREHIKKPKASKDAHPVGLTLADRCLALSFVRAIVSCVVCKRLHGVVVKLFWRFLDVADARKVLVVT